MIYPHRQRREAFCVIISSRLVNCVINRRLCLRLDVIVMSFNLISASLVPLELPITKREHFNRWYSSGAYYLALFISDIPVTISCCTMYTFIIYFLTNQPMETFRLLNVTLIGILTCFSAQAYGMLIGAMFVNIQV